MTAQPPVTAEAAFIARTDGTRGLCVLIPCTCGCGKVIEAEFAESVTRKVVAEMVAYYLRDGEDER